MKQSKSRTLTAAIYGILFGLFNLVVFMVFKKHEAVFWISYAFMTVAFIAHIICLLVAFKGGTIEAAFYGIPLASLSVYYFFAELFCCFVFMIFQQAGVKSAVLVQAILLGVFLVVAIMAVIGRDTVTDAKAKIEAQVLARNTWADDLNILPMHTDNAELKQRLKRLAEKAKYADPISRPEVENMDNRISSCISDIRTYIEAGQVDMVTKLCGEVELLLADRGQRLKSLK